MQRATTKEFLERFMIKGKDDYSEIHADMATMIIGNLQKEKLEHLLKSPLTETFYALDLHMRSKSSFMVVEDIGRILPRNKDSSSQMAI